MNRYQRAALATLATASLAVASLIGIATPASAQPIPAPSCHDVSIAATYALLIPVTVAGQLCVPGDGDTSTVEVLIPGATYNKTYYDAAPDASYQRQEGDDGIATLALDRLGTGGSTYLPAASITGAGQDAVIHQVITALRAGTITGSPVSDVVLLGHSLGSLETEEYAATYHDINGLVLTGFTHALTPIVLAQVFTRLVHPAILDPKFIGKTLDPGELTSYPGERVPFFDNVSDIDPAVAALEDGPLKDMVATGEVGDAVLLGEYLPASLTIAVPTLIVTGQDDIDFCATVAMCATSASLHAEEAPYFSVAAHLSTYVLPNAGHSVAIAANGQIGADAVAAFVHG
jgi:pimeloyl-ACP methyl ester carboxylesterase